MTGKGIKMSEKSRSRGPYAKRPTICYSESEIPKKQIKSSLGGFQRLVTAAKNLRCLRSEHFGMIEQSPFSRLFFGFYDEKLSLNQFRRLNCDLWRLVLCFDVESECFDFGSLKMQLTPNDVKKVFGLERVELGHFCNIHHTNEDREMEFAKKYFPGKSEYFVADIFNAFLNAIKVKDTRAVEDSVCLMTMYLCATLFFPLSNSKLPKSMFRKCLNLDDVNRMDWAGEIFDFLLKQLKQKGKYINGCVLAILYWFCDVSNIIQPIKGVSDDDPSFLKWNVAKFNAKMDRKSFEEIFSPIIQPQNETSVFKTLTEENEWLKDEIVKLKKLLKESEVENEKLRTVVGKGEDPVEEPAVVGERVAVFEEEVNVDEEDEHDEEVGIVEGGVAVNEIDVLVEEHTIGEDEAAVLFEKPVERTNDESETVEKNDGAGVASPPSLTNVEQIQDQTVGEENKEGTSLHSVTNLEQNQTSRDENEEAAIGPRIPSRILRLKARDDRKKVDLTDDFEITSIVPYISDVPYKSDVISAIPINFAMPKDKINETKEKVKNEVKRTGKRKAIDVDDGKEPKKKKSSKDFGSFKRTRVWICLDESDKNKLSEFFKKTSIEDHLWGYDDDAVGIDEVEQLIKSDCISSNVINSYLVIKSKEEEHKKSLFMSTLAWDCVSRDDVDGIREQLFLPLIENWGKVDKVFFPMNIPRDNHFVLLVIDKKKATSTFYDSLKVKLDSERYSDAYTLHTAVQNAFDEMKMNGREWANARKMSVVTTRGKKRTIEITDSMIVSIGDSDLKLIMNMGKCPEQPARSLDCGIAVTLFAEMLSKDESIEDYLTPVQMNLKMTAMRKTMLRAFLEDENSWAYGTRTDARADPMLGELTTQLNK